MTPGTPNMGGITVNSTNDAYGLPPLLQDEMNALIAAGKLNNGASIIIGPSPAIDSGSGALTLRAVGDVSITNGNGIATGGN